MQKIAYPGLITFLAVDSVSTFVLDISSLLSPKNNILCYVNYDHQHCHTRVKAGCRVTTICARQGAHQTNSRDRYIGNVHCLHTISNEHTQLGSRGHKHVPQQGLVDRAGQGPDTDGHLHVAFPFAHSPAGSLRLTTSASVPWFSFRVSVRYRAGRDTENE